MLYYLSVSLTRKMKKIEKNKITYIHFLLTILVILVHSANNNSLFERIFSIEVGIGQFAIPLFFIISGFLFFHKANTINDVKNKIIKRFYSLVIPYLIWNLIYYIFHLILEPETKCSLETLIDVILNYSYNPVFWYIHQLILLTIISPIIYYFVIIYKSEIILFISLSLLIILDINIPFINEDAIIYYSFGALLSRLYKEKRFKIINKEKIVIPLVLSIVLYALNRQIHKYIFSNIELLPYYTLTIIYLRISVAMTIFYICDMLFNYKSVPIFMLNNFFLYSIHYIIVRFIIILTNNHLIKYINNDNFIIIQIIIFIISPIICICISNYLSLFLSKNTPKFYNLITGNRLSIINHRYTNKK